MLIKDDVSEIYSTTAKHYNPYKLHYTDAIS